MLSSVQALVKPSLVTAQFDSDFRSRSVFFETATMDVSISYSNGHVHRVLRSASSERAMPEMGRQ